MIKTLDEILLEDSDFSRRIKEKLLFEGGFKNKVRHKIVHTKNDIEGVDILLKLKEELFEGNSIYLFGSRVNGKYITKEEVQLHKLTFPHITESDWDIRSEYIPSKEKLKSFEENHGIKIDFQFGKTKIEI